MRGFLERIHAGEILVADGATGTSLQAAGLEAGSHTEDWVFDHPERILELEQAFVKAGSSLLLTCTFGGTALRMRGSKYEPRVAELNREAARLARQAAGTGNQVLVGGSMGPLGQLLKPYGPIERDDAESAYAEQAGALASGGVDLIAIETQYSLEEATAAIAGARSVTDLPIMVSFSYDRGTRTMMGLRPRAAMHLVEAGGIAMIGVNCGTTLENAVQVLSEYHATLPGFPLWAKPNAGLPRVEAGRTVFDVTPDGMTQFAERAVELGALVVGGCCGSTPAHLRAIARAVGARQVTGRLA